MKNKFTLIFIFLVFLKIFLLIGYPILAEGYAQEDDRLYIKYAHNMGMGQWLGPFNNWTLAKGMFFSFWLLLLDYSGIPYLIGIFSFYALAIYYFYKAISDFVKVKWALYVFTIIMLFNPYVEYINRVVREGIYASLTIIIVAALLHIIRRAQMKKPFVLSSIICGISLGCFWNTREEGVWILPILVLGICYLTFYFRIQKGYHFTKMLKLMRSLAFIPFFAISITALIAGLNYKYYNTFTTVDFKSKNYQSAYASLNRVKNLNPTCRTVPVNKETRELIYKVSPTFKILSTQLENPKYAYLGFGCSHYECSCKDYAGGWFMWAFRLAVAQNGFYNDGPTAESFFLKISQEIDLACENELLDCYEKNNSLIPNLIDGDYHSIYRAMLLGVNDLQKGYRNLPIWKNSSGSDEDLKLFRKLTNTSENEITRLYQPSKFTITKLNIFTKIKGLYDFMLFPILYFINLIVLFMIPVLLYKYRKIDITLFLYLGVLSIITVRLLILSIIHATSFPGVSLMYISPLFSFTPMLALCGISLVATHSSSIRSYLMNSKIQVIFAVLLIGICIPLSRGMQDMNSWTPEIIEGYKIKDVGTDYVIDAANGILLSDYKKIIEVESETLIIEGWAIDKIAQNIPKTIFVEIDGQLIKAENQTIKRADLASINSLYVNSGYKLIIPLKNIKKGIHTIRLMILEHTGEEIFQPQESKSIIIKLLK